MDQATCAQAELETDNVAKFQILFPHPVCMKVRLGEPISNASVVTTTKTYFSLDYTVVVKTSIIHVGRSDVCLPILITRPLIVQWPNANLSLLESIMKVKTSNKAIFYKIIIYL